MSMAANILTNTKGSLKYFLNTIISSLQLQKLNLQGKIGVFILGFFILIAIFGPLLAPYNPYERLTYSNGKVKSLEPPSYQNILGTTWQGRDVLSQVLHGCRPTLIAGGAAALVIAFIGVNIGILAGYFGGRTDMVLMRFVDIVFGLPFLPFIVVLVCLMGPTQTNVIIAIGLIAWRTVSRVIRAQVLTLKELPYIRAARVMGASHLRIIYVHIFPNVLPLSVLYLAFGIGWAILAHADLCFLGFGDPDMVTWGSMIYSAWSAGVINEAFWWYIPPAISLSILSSGAFLYARAFEEVANPRLEDR